MPRPEKSGYFAPGGMIAATVQVNRDRRYLEDFETTGLEPASPWDALRPYVGSFISAWKGRGQ
jgi:hypothetical protein